MIKKCSCSNKLAWLKRNSRYEGTINYLLAPTVGKKVSIEATYQRAVSILSKFEYEFLCFSFLTQSANRLDPQLSKEAEQIYRFYQAFLSQLEGKLGANFPQKFQENVHKLRAGRIPFKQAEIFEDYLFRTQYIDQLYILSVYMDFLTRLSYFFPELTSQCSSLREMLATKRENIFLIVQSAVELINDEPVQFEGNIPHETINSYVATIYATRGSDVSSMRTPAQVLAYMGEMVLAVQPLILPEKGPLKCSPLLPEFYKKHNELIKSSSLKENEKEKILLSSSTETVIKKHSDRELAKVGLWILGGSVAFIAVGIGLASLFPPLAVLYLIAGAFMAPIIGFKWAIYNEPDSAKKREFESLLNQHDKNCMINEGSNAAKLVQELPEPTSLPASMNEQNNEPQGLQNEAAPSASTSELEKLEKDKGRERLLPSIP